MSDISFIRRIAEQYPLLTREQEIALAKRCARRETKAIHAMALHNMRLLFKVANDHLGRGLDFDDLVMSGYPGLQKAADRYVLTKGTKFCTYAVYWIAHHIRDAINKHRSDIRVPSHVQEKWSKVYRAMRDHLLTTGFEPTVEEIAEATGFLPSQVMRCQSAIPTIVSLDAQLGGEDSGVRGDFIPDDAMDPSTYAARRDDFRAVRDALDKLSRRDRHVLRLRMGFVHGRIYTLEAIAAQLHVCRERVRQIEAEASRRLGQILCVHKVAQDSTIMKGGKNASLEWNKKKGADKASERLKERGDKARKLIRNLDSSFRQSHGDALSKPQPPATRKYTGAQRTQIKHSKPKP